MLTQDAVLLALVVFVLRVVNNAMGTVRVVLITRQRRLLASGLGFIESLIFAVTITSVVTDLSNILNLVAYCGGFSVGSYLGMYIEDRFIKSYVTVNIIAQNHGHEIAVALRDAGYGVTESTGEGLQGPVVMLHSVVVHRDLPRLLAIVREKNPDAFVSMEQLRAIQRGFVRASRPLTHG